MGDIDWRVVQRYASAQGVKDFDRFLDAMPLNVGYNALIAAGVVWIMAVFSVMFASNEIAKAGELRTQIVEVEALQPPIPTMKYVPVGQGDIKRISDNVMATYKGINIISAGEGGAVISAQDTDFFPQFLAAVSFLQSGGKNWKVAFKNLCVGRDCTGSKLSATLTLQEVRVGEPVKKEE